MAESASSLLRRLERAKGAYGAGSAAEKVGLLERLEGRGLPDAAAVHRFHEVLCFLRAYPDDRRVLDRVERILGGFARRPDLQRHRRALADSGIAGTPITYPFYWFTARRLARRWPHRLSIVWADFENAPQLVAMLPLLLPFFETPALDEADLTAGEWIERLKGPEETDAAFLIRRFEKLAGDAFGREKQYEDLDVPIRIAPAPGPPSRTHAKHGGSPIVYQAAALERHRPVLRREVLRPPAAVRPLSPRRADRLIDLARDAMVTRSRDLDVFVHADRRDVRLVDCGSGYAFAWMGVVPERRLMFEAVQGLLTLKNGVPIGYALVSAFFGSAGVAYNIFDTYRGAETARVFGRLLAAVRHLLGVDAFSIDPYQLGYGNAEGLESGAWWFYYKLGFRPHDPGVRDVLRGELARMREDPGHRSTLATLEKLAAEHVYLYLGRRRRDVLGRIDLGQAGLAVSRYVAERFGADREEATRTCAREAARLLGVRSRRGFSSGERLAWSRWGPLVLALPGVAGWTSAEKRALAAVARAKGGHRETDFVRLFDRHAKLCAAFLKLSRRPDPH